MAERILVVGCPAGTSDILLAVGGRRRFEVVAVLEEEAGGRASAREWRARLEAAVRRTRPDRLVVACAERRGHALMRALLDVCMLHGIPVEEPASLYERVTGRIAVEALSPSTIVFSWAPRASRAWDGLGRAAAIVVAVTLLAILAPVLALIALAIKLESRGPVLFVQDRLGIRGRPFRLLKFRTMHEAPGPRSEWEHDNRHRVTRVGWWLRRFRLDEVPQLVNVLRGEMNLVGPRPHPVSNGELFTLVGRNLNERTGSPVAYYALRLTVKPGLTGWAQVRYRYANNLEEEIEKLRYDLYYVKHRSPLFDLRILFETLAVLLCGHRSAASEGGAAELQPAHAVRTPA